MQTGMPTHMWWQQQGAWQQVFKLYLLALMPERTRKGASYVIRIIQLDASEKSEAAGREREGRYV